jgi:hypothetical protein
MRSELETALIAARTLPSEELPRLLGDLEEVRATALARLAAPALAHTGPDELIDVQEASRRLGISRDYLYHHHSSFDFTRHVGRRLLFSVDGIQAHIRGRR